MKIVNLPCKSALLGLKMLLGCLLFSLMLCLLTLLPVAAQAESLTPISAPLKGYAELGFYVPSNAAVEAESITEANYTEGREVKATMFVNESRVSVHLIYPCQAPATLLEPDALKAAINAYNPAMSQAVYNPTPLNISEQSASWGQVGSQIFVAYQPSVKTIALVLIDETLDENTMEYLLGSLQVTVNDGTSPLWPGFCPDTSATAAVPAQAASGNSAIAAGSNLLENLKSGGMKPATGAGDAAAETGKERMSSGLQAAQEKLASLKK